MSAPDGVGAADTRAPVRRRAQSPSHEDARLHRGRVGRPRPVRLDGPLRLTLQGVHVQGRRAAMLHLPGLSLATGECVLVAGEPGQGHTALALVATGRLAPFGGSVDLTDADGTTTTDSEVLRRVSAVVDLPGISEPDDNLPAVTVVAEELALAGVRSGRGHVHEWLDSHGLTRYRDVRMDDLAGPVRTALLTSLALERRDVRFLVISLPDRHGGDPAEWWAVAQACAARGYGVLVQCWRSSARELGAELAPACGDASQRATPVETLRTGADELAALTDSRQRTDTRELDDTQELDYTQELDVARDEREESEVEPHEAEQ
ncbi:hypothetical protein [Cellulomonas xiejunii]|uniref:ABC transporter ATP-binding protein n=1 Tax=Cellulomonas xiejunii TaxID=2968083 RepID=A0ABY5KV01_9CELL|nr:hypothetical protein [Cellulomonas xiejunii]MCC2322997.1 hypothetical protein [Cellulomonas xiejunii]UUI73494.1 hypothetical protein NP048_08725 [Cellulomonas xiejunii]